MTNERSWFIRLFETMEWEWMNYNTDGLSCTNLLLDKSVNEGKSSMKKRLPMCDAVLNLHTQQSWVLLLESWLSFKANIPRQSVQSRCMANKSYHFHRHQQSASLHRCALIGDIFNHARTAAAAATAASSFTLQRAVQNSHTRLIGPVCVRDMAWAESLPYIYGKKFANRNQ